MIDGVNMGIVIAAAYRKVLVQTLKATMMMTIINRSANLEIHVGRHGRLLALGGLAQSEQSCAH
eukprot:8255371-Heterocapsa_arctica.AAC.1